MESSKRVTSQTSNPMAKPNPGMIFVLCTLLASLGTQRDGACSGRFVLNRISSCPTSA